MDVRIPHVVVYRVLTFLSSWSWTGRAEESLEQLGNKKRIFLSQ